MDLDVDCPKKSCYTYSLLELLKTVTKIVRRVSFIKLEADISICISLKENFITWF